MKKTTKRNLILALRVGLENTIALREALRCAIRVVYPRLPMGMGRPAIMEDGTVWTIDDPRDLRVNTMNPLTVLREEGCKVVVRRLWSPLLNYAGIARGTVAVFRRIKRDRAGKPAPKCSLKVVCAHMTNAPGS